MKLVLAFTPRVARLVLSGLVSLFALAGCGEDVAVTPQTPAAPGTPAANAPPSISGSPATTVAAGQVYSFQPTASDTNGDALTFAATNLPTWATINASSGLLAGTPTLSVVGNYPNIVVSVSDGTATASLAAFAITVQAAPASNGNRAPTISGAPVTTVASGGSYSFQPTATDADGDTLAFTIQGKPAWASFATATGRLTGTPTAAQAGTYSGIVISVSDGKAAAVALPAFAVIVSSAPNAAPTITGTAAVTVAAGSFYSFSPTALDPNNDPLLFSVQNLPAWAALNTRSGRISGTPASSDTGTFANIVISVSDGALSATLAPFTITVTASSGSGTGTYPGYTYSLPTVRPFISLSHYDSGSLTSAAFLRLKAQADGAVTVTNNQSSSVTYDQLVTALNSAHYGYSTTDSVILYRLTGDPKYIQQAIRMVDLFVTSENAKITAGAVPVIAHDSYLEVGFYMEQLALAYDYGYNLLSPTQRSTWAAFAEQTIFNVWNYNTASWGGVSRPWTGWSVNDPGNNYFYSFLKATQLWSLASQNMTWITYLQTQKYTLMVPFFSALTGGGSREGTGYGTAMGNLFEDYAYWKGSTGEDLSAYSTHARETIDYWIHATVPTFDYFASIGDQSRSAMPIMFDYQRKLMELAVALYPATAQGRRGTWWLNRAKVTDGGSGTLVGRMRYNYDFRYDLLTAASSEEAPTSLLYNATGTGALFARSDWTTSASWMHTNAGYYDQSHAHQDQGSFSFYKNGWLSITSNVYSNSGINQDVDVHNVIRFMSGGNAIGQTESVSSKTVTDNGGVVQISETLTPAYANSGGRVSSWLRELTYERATHRLSVHDYCTVSSGTTPVWQLHVPVQPVLQSDGSYLAGSLRITPVTPATPTVNIVNMHTLSSDFSSGYRLELTGPVGSCEFSVDLRAQ
ncbi:MAG: putative Ig domain-containing protein [Pseudomonadota bacterium]